MFVVALWLSTIFSNSNGAFLGSYDAFRALITQFCFCDLRILRKGAGFRCPVHR